MGTGTAADKAPAIMGTGTAAEKASAVPHTDITGAAPERARAFK
jgi:hypothetical protein